MPELLGHKPSISDGLLAVQKLNPESNKITEMEVNDEQPVGDLPRIEFKTLIVKPTLKNKRIMERRPVAADIMHTSENTSIPYHLSSN